MANIEEAYGSVRMQAELEINLVRRLPFLEGRNKWVTEARTTVSNLWTPLEIEFGLCVSRYLPFGFQYVGDRRDTTLCTPADVLKE